jgi:hypothetical protein
MFIIGFVFSPAAATAKTPFLPPSAARFWLSSPSATAAAATADY